MMDNYIATCQFMEMFEAFFPILNPKEQYPKDTEYKVRDSFWKKATHFFFPCFFREAFEPKFNSSYGMSVLRTAIPYFNLFASISIASISPYMAYQAIVKLENTDTEVAKGRTFLISCIPFLFLREYYSSYTSFNKYISLLINKISEGATLEVRQIRQQLIQNTKFKISSSWQEISQNLTNHTYKIPSLESLFLRLSQRLNQGDNYSTKQNLFAILYIPLFMSSVTVIMGTPAQFLLGQFVGNKLLLYFGVSEDTIATQALKTLSGLFVVGLKGFIGFRTGLNCWKHITYTAQAISLCANPDSKHKRREKWASFFLEKDFFHYSWRVYFIQFILAAGIGTTLSIPIYKLSRSSIPQSHSDSVLGKLLLASIYAITFGQSYIKTIKNLSIYMRNWPKSSSTKQLTNLHNREVKQLSEELQFFETCSDEIILKIKKSADSIRAIVSQFSATQPQLSSFRTKYKNIFHQVLRTILSTTQETEKYIIFLDEHIDGPTFQCALEAPIVGSIQGFGCSLQKAQEEAASYALSKLQGSQRNKVYILPYHRGSYTKFVQQYAPAFEAWSEELNSPTTLETFHIVLYIKPKNRNRLTFQADNTSVITAFEAVAKNAYDTLLMLEPHFPRYSMDGINYRSLLEMWHKGGLINSLKWTHTIQESKRQNLPLGRFKHHVKTGNVTAGPFGGRWRALPSLIFRSFGLAASTTPYDIEVAQENASFKVFHQILETQNQRQRQKQK